MSLEFNIIESFFNYYKLQEQLKISYRGEDIPSVQSRDVFDWTS